MMPLNSTTKNHNIAYVVKGYSTVNLLMAFVAL